MEITIAILVCVAACFFGFKIWEYSKFFSILLIVCGIVGPILYFELGPPAYDKEILQYMIENGNDEDDFEEVEELEDPIEPEEELINDDNWVSVGYFYAVNDLGYTSMLEVVEEDGTPFACEENSNHYAYVVHCSDYEIEKILEETGYEVNYKIEYTDCSWYFLWQ